MRARHERLEEGRLDGAQQVNGIEGQAPLRILHYLNTSGIGGTEISVLNLCLAMPSETVGVVFSHEGPIIPRFIRAGVPTLIVGKAEPAPLGQFGHSADLINFTVYADTPDIDRVQAASGLPAIGCQSLRSFAFSAPPR